MTEKNTILKSLMAQFGSVIIAALGAALIAFIQSVVSSSGVCTIPPGDPSTAGALGAILKSGHSAFKFGRDIMLG